MLQAHLKAYTDDNLLANRALVQWLASVPPALLDKVVPSSFPSLKSTLLHIWDVEASWLCDLMGQPEQHIMTDFANAPNEAVFAGLVNTSVAFRDYVTGVKESELLTPCTYLRYDGTWESRFPFEIIQHSMNHSTFHRGQLMSIARILGLGKPPLSSTARSI